MNIVNKENKENKTEKRELGTGASCFLIKDESVKGALQESYVYRFLTEEGFISWKGAKWQDGVDWIYINIYSKVFSKGMQGISLTKAVGNHAITWEEFLTVYKIYKKYEGLSVLEMTGREDSLLS